MSDSRGFAVWARRLALPAIIGLALLMILPLALNTRIAEYDEAVLLDAARNIQRVGLPLRSVGTGGAPLLEHTPAYAFLLSLYAPKPGDGLFLARGVTALAGLLCVLLSYAIAAALAGRRAGLLAAAFVALNAFLAVYAYFVRMETFMAAGILAAFYLLVRRRPLTLGHCLGAGIALAAATLFKEFALVAVVPAAVFAALTGGKAIRSRAAAAMAVAAPPLLALLAWGVWASALWPTQFRAAMERWLHSAAGGPVTDPRAFTSTPEWLGQLGADLFGPGLVIGLAVAVVWLVRRRGRVDGREALLWGYLALALGLSLAVRLREPRHLIALAPVAAILSGVALAGMWQAAEHRPAQRGLAATGIALLLLLSGPWGLLGMGTSAGLTPSYRDRLAGDAHYALLARAGEEAARLSEPGEVLVVAHQGPVIAYYADRRYLTLYTMDEPAIQRALAGARLLVWDTPTWLALPQERVPAVEARVAADFAPVASVSEGPRVVTIYERKR
ncbi:MAG: glycosyltransferase family 39 protein [Anaerolineae bacterium]|nr:glycosyltransferase family 39 protein [Anaerolineae bacterium]